MQPGTGLESSRRLSALFELSLTLETTADFSGILDQLLAKAIGIMSAERGFIMLADPGSRNLKVHVARDRGGPISDLESESVSRSLMTQVLDSGKPVLVANAQSAEWGTKSMLANQIHSALCVPLKSHDDVTGVIYVDHRSRDSAFTEQDLAFFTTFAILAKAAIDSSRAYWELVDSIFKASDDFIVVCGTDGRIKQANRGAANLLGLNAAEIASRSFESLFNEPYREKAAALCATALRTGLASETDIELSGRGGRPVPMSISGFSLRDRAGGSAGICLIGRDLSEVKALIRQLEEANSKLQELNDMKSELVGMIAHEFKNALAVISGYADIMIHHPGRSPKDVENLGFIMQGVERLIRLISELLDLTRIETGKIGLRPSVFNVELLVREVAEQCTLRAQQKDVQVDLCIAPDLPPLEGDRDLIWRAVDNLFTNGIKYNRSGRRFAVTIKFASGEFALSFADEGIGISAEDQKKLFQRFFRSDSVRQIAGTGLGLSIVKAIVERHDGRISAESEIGKGTTFRVFLPAKPSPADG